MVATSPYLAERGGGGVITGLTRDALAPTMGLRVDIAIGLVLEIFGICLTVIGPYCLKVLVDGLTDNRLPSAQVSGLICLFVFSWAGAVVLSTWRMVFSVRVIDRLAEHLALRALQSKLPVSASARDGDSGELLGLLERLPFALSVVVDGLIWRALPLVFQVVCSLAIMAAVIPLTYSIALLGVLSLYAATTWMSAVRHQKFAGAANAAAGAVSADAGDVLRNARRVILNGALALELASMGGRYREKTAANAAMIGSLTAMSFVQYGLLGVGLVVLLVVAGNEVAIGSMTLSNFILLQAYAFRLVIPLSGFGFIVSQAASAIATIGEVRGLCRDDNDDEMVAPVPLIPAEIRLDNVAYRYGAGEAELEQINAVIPAGSFTVIVGPNGSGKSTLAQIIAGILTPASGQVFVNEENLSTVPASARHFRVLYVPQMVTLFNRSLKTNALYPPTVLTEAGLVGLLAQWRFHDDGRNIDLTASVGEGGERLSGGQLQKLELARVAGIRAPAIILDESTSALDPASEAEVIATLRERAVGRSTLIAVCHRIGLAESADQVLFVKSGRLARSGTHARLMLDSEAYARLWTT